MRQFGIKEQLDGDTSSTKKIFRYWLKYQGNTKASSERARMDYIWGASIVKTCLRMMIDLWGIRKEEINSKEEVTKQQKRKEKEAISVRIYINFKR